MNNLIELVRKETNAERMFLLYPSREFDGLVQAHSIAYNKHIAIDLEFFFKKYGIQVWVNVNNQHVHFYPGNMMFKCFYIRYFARFLYQKNKEAYFIFIYSLFFNMKRAHAVARDTVARAKDAHADAYAVEAAYADAVDAAYNDAHADAVEATYADAVEAAYAVADAYADEAAYAVEAARAVALAAHEAAYNDAHADAVEAAYARKAAEAISRIAYTEAEVDSLDDVRKALRALVKFRKFTNF
jgi:hypothetical protein